MTRQAPSRLNAALEGRYVVEREIGSGGMATVYLAKDLRHRRPVALKVLDPDLSATVGADRFLREIETVANLIHPHILPLFDSGQAGGLLFFVMPYVEGESLRARLDREGQLPVDDAVRIAREIADALAYAHERGVIHRDVKPANVLLQAGHAVLADFGMAQAMAEAGDARLTVEGVSLGTPYYMSPEQAAGESDLDGRTDQYALGCVLYEMLVGEPPFTGTTTRAVITKRFVQPAADVTTLRSGVPEVVGQAVGRALSLEALDRFERTAELSFALRGDTEASASVRTGNVGKSIAVLPFANLSADQESEYFSDGITEDIITHLSKLPDLKVISRTSVMRLKGSEKSLREIGSELGVDTILEGSVRRFRDRVRIVAQLIDARRDEHLWAETYDRELVDVFAIQSDVAQKIAAALDSELADAPAEQIEKKPTRNITAYQQYLRGRFFLAKRNEAGLRRAIEYFDQALEADPTYASAYAGIADCYNLLPWYGSTPPVEAFPKAKVAARRALELDESVAEAHKSLAFATMLYDWDWVAADRGFTRALELNSGEAATHHWYFEYLVAVGRLDDAMREIQIAYELDPLSLIVTSAYGWGHYFRREYDKAIRQVEKALEMDPGFIWARFILSKARLKSGLYDAVIADAAAMPPVVASHPLMLATVGAAHAMGGQHAQAREVVGRITAAANDRYVSPYIIGLVHLGLGETQVVVDYLEKAFDQRDFWMVFLRSDPLWDPVRDDPRIRGLIDRMGLGSGTQGGATLTSSPDP